MPSSEGTDTATTRVSKGSSEHRKWCLTLNGGTVSRHFQAVIAQCAHIPGQLDHEDAVDDLP